MGKKSKENKSGGGKNRERTKSRKQKSSFETRDRRWLTMVPRILDINPPKGQ